MRWKMRNKMLRSKELKTFLKQSFYQKIQSEIKPERLDETIVLCTDIMKKQRNKKAEARTDFFAFLADVFYYEGLPVFCLQALTLFFVCLLIYTVAGAVQNIPIFTPLFVIAVLPMLFKSQYYGMGELEAVTRASGTQIMLAKLILAGAANIVCLTVLLMLEVRRQNAGGQIGQMVLYCLVPYLLCAVMMLRLLRLRRRENMVICAACMFGFCVCFGVSAKIAPQLYETSAAGIWIVAFAVFAGFFVREICATVRAEGRMLSE